MPLQKQRLFSFCRGCLCGDFLFTNFGSWGQCNGVYPERSRRSALVPYNNAQPFKPVVFPGVVRIANWTIPLKTKAYPIIEPQYSHRYKEKTHRLCMCMLMFLLCLLWFKIILGYAYSFYLVIILIPPLLPLFKPTLFKL
jgi:hypothetical protein